ncbi:M-phase phosphoprotein 8 isoform X1 [Hydra vulgaris]|uniref:M-phase phosphoprotein 8 isoform X1 n=1 Tax=Hydra vulgaris TaxID=6087 RepID=UPI001F5F24DD|nr:M-phase phosphoprotein 8 isoform X1 [Hydra vulgaris]
MSDFASEDDVFEVEKIVASRLDKDGLRRVFRVRWKGCKSDEDTWEPLENLLSCNELLKQYKEERRKRKKLKKNKLNVTKEFSTQSAFSKVKEEPKEEVKTARKKDDSKLQFNVKKQTESIRGSLPKRKKPDLFLNTDTDLAGFTRKQRHEMERAVEESKKLSPVLSDTEDLANADNSNVKSKSKKKRIRRILDDSSDDSLKSPKLSASSATSVENVFSFTNVLGSPSNSYISLVDQLQKKSENTIIYPENNTISPEVNKLKVNEKKPTINLKSLSALKSKLGSSIRSSSSPPVPNTSFSPSAQGSVLSSLSSGLSPLDTKSSSFPLVSTLSSSSSVQSAPLATPMKNSSLSVPVQHSSLSGVQFEKDYVSEHSRNIESISPNRKNALPKNQILNKDINPKTTDFESLQTSSSSIESQNKNKPSNLPLEVVISNIIPNICLPITAETSRAASSLLVSNPSLSTVETSGIASSLLVSNPSLSTKFLLSSVFSKINLDSVARKKSIKKNNKLTESSKNICIDSQTNHVALQIDTNISETADKVVTGIDETADKVVTDISHTACKIVTDISETGDKVVTGIRETGDKVVTGIRETGDKVVANISEIADKGVNNKVDLKEQISSESFEKNVKEFQSNDKDLHKNISEAKQNFQKLGIDFSVFKPKPNVTIAKKPKDAEDTVNNQSTVLSKATKEAKNVKQTIVDKSKKLSYIEYQAKIRRKSSEHADTGLFLDFLKVPSALSEISSQPDGVDKAVILNSKASAEKVVTIEKKKDKFVKEIDSSKIDGRELASSEDVLGTILETIGPIKEISSKLAANNENKQVTTENEDVIMEESLNEEFLNASDFEYDLDDYSGDEDGLLMIPSLTSKKVTHETLNANTKSLDLLVIHQAIVVGDAMTVIQSKISANEINNYVDDMDTLLMKAVMECSPDMVRIILEKSADPNTPSKNGKTPLMMAVELQQRSLVVMLIQNGAKMNIQTPSGETALILACKMGHIEIVHVLLNSGADVKPAATYLEKMAVPKHLRSSLQFTLQIHSEKLKYVTEKVFMDIIKFDKLPIQIDHQLMGCRCISPDETGEHDFFFECDVYVKDRHVQVVLLALPTLFERCGSVTPLFNAQNNGVKDVLLNNESMIQVLPNSHYIYFLYPKHGEVNFLRVLSDITCTNKILVCVYAINFEKASSISQTVSPS